MRPLRNREDRGSSLSLRIGSLNLCKRITLHFSNTQTLVKKQYLFGKVNQITKQAKHDKQPQAGMYPGKHLGVLDLGRL